MLQILNGKKRKGRGQKKRAFPYLSKLSWNGLSKYTTETQWKNDTSRPGFEWHSGFGQNPLQTGIYFPLSSCFWGGNGKGQDRKWPRRRRVMANIFWIIGGFNCSDHLHLYMCALFRLYLYTVNVQRWHHVRPKQNNNYFSLQYSALATNKNYFVAGSAYLEVMGFRDIWNWLFSRQKCRRLADKWHDFWDSGPNVDIHTPSLHSYAYIPAV